ncbi:hypothetical protein ACFSFZ_09515 [Mixta tenebrionis]|uniref:Uncharacterized protein n=1 Tax=Mixta tenebrionis TaxID=2562439 RepID=A0A506VAK8_9GAMM|nr:hypothetical protein [Mixta tenebrionis]TPW42767.1 hypothetical protein FKM52_08310 [Mixta tenebrionis]
MMLVNPIIHNILFVISVFLLNQKCTPDLERFVLLFFLILALLSLLCDLVYFLDVKKILYLIFLVVKSLLVVLILFNGKGLAGSERYIAHEGNIYFYYQENIADPGAYLIIYEKSNEINPFLSFRVKKRSFFINSSIHLIIIKMSEGIYCLMSDEQRQYKLDTRSWTLKPINNESKRDKKDSHW